jgi:protein-arginine kinase
MSAPSARQDVQNHVSELMQTWNSSNIASGEPVVHHLHEIATSLNNSGFPDLASDMRELNAINNDAKHFNDVHFDNATGKPK